MSISDIRFTVLQTVNEVQRKLGLDETALTANKISKELVSHINDVVDDLSDFGNWMECLVTANVTAISSVQDYSIQTSAVIKNIGDIFITDRIGPMTSLDIEAMRIRTRVTSYGVPSQFCIFGTDSNGNPLLRVAPIPNTATNGAVFSVLLYTKPPLYTTSDSAVVIPFPSRVVVLGTLAAFTLRENGGAPNDLYKMFFQQYLDGRKNALNRFNFDTGWDIAFQPGYNNRFRR